MLRCVVLTILFCQLGASNVSYNLSSTRSVSRRTHAVNRSERMQHEHAERGDPFLDAELLILYVPRMRKMADALGKLLNTKVALCTDQLSLEPDPNDAIMIWDRFENKDPNIKVRADALIGKHVILLLATDKFSNLFDQLSVVLWLQSFYVPRSDPKLPKKSWKEAVSTCSFSMQSVGALTIVMPWIRYETMDRSQRWSCGDKQCNHFINSEADGPLIDIPTIQTFAALLSADPPPAPGDCPGTDHPLPPKEFAERVTSGPGGGILMKFPRRLDGRAGRPPEKLAEVN